MPADLRPALSPFLDAFGVSITVTRPAPDNAAVETTGIWLSPLSEEPMFGSDLKRREPRRRMAVPRDADTLPSIPRGSTVLAPEDGSGPVRTWKVDGYDSSIDVDHVRIILVPTP